MEVGTYVRYTMAMDCTGFTYATSYAHLGATDFAFSPSITSYIVARGYNAKGSGFLSSYNQLLTVKSMGYCGHTYIENSPYRSENLVQIEFLK